MKRKSKFFKWIAIFFYIATLMFPLTCVILGKNERLYKIVSIILGLIGLGMALMYMRCPYCKKFGISIGLFTPNTVKCKNCGNKVIFTKEFNMFERGMR